VTYDISWTNDKIFLFRDHRDLAIKNNVNINILFGLVNELGDDFSSSIHNKALSPLADHCALEIYTLDAAFYEHILLKLKPTIIKKVSFCDN
jgi:hypothetical protein